MDIHLWYTNNNFDRHEIRRTGRMKNSQRSRGRNWTERQPFWLEAAILQKFQRLGYLTNSDKEICQKIIPVASILRICLKETQWPKLKRESILVWSGHITFGKSIGLYCTRTVYLIFWNLCVQAALRRLASVCPDSIEAADHQQLIKPRLVDSFLLCSNMEESFVWC